MNKEQLLELNLSEEQAVAVLNALETSQMIPKARFDEVNNAKKSLETQVNDYVEQLKGLQKNAEGNETLQAEITKLQDAQKDLKLQYEQQLKDERVNAALKLAVAGKVHDADLVTGLIDRATIEVDESGKVVKGLDEQLTSLQESKSFLFVQQQEPPKPGIKGANPAPGADPSNTPKTGFGASIAQSLNANKKPAVKSPWG